jgi:mannose/cellobiose epimerase-like protein (N-acyl-D-glucosamine 2-epimerase family)
MTLCRVSGVGQARMLWFFSRLSRDPVYGRKGGGAAEWGKRAEHGLRFLADTMWDQHSKVGRTLPSSPTPPHPTRPSRLTLPDVACRWKQLGGFHDMVSCEGLPVADDQAEGQGQGGRRSTYNHAFAVYALAEHALATQQRQPRKAKASLTEH